MSVEVLQMLSLGAYIASGVFFCISVTLFFILRIPGVIGNLSGATARKAIEDIRQQSSNNEGRSYKSMRLKTDRERNTDKISTQKLLQQSQETILLPQTNATTLLTQTESDEKSKTPEFHVDIDIGFSESTEIIE